MNITKERLEELRGRVCASMGERPGLVISVEDMPDLLALIDENIEQLKYFEEMEEHEQRKAAEEEQAERDLLIKLGWTPPAEKPASVNRALHILDEAESEKMMREED